jgi:energy-coupling factor transporter ATP-binding protein EcfA2
MAALRPILDRKRSGTQYTDRMHRILGVCHDCGLLWHNERVTYRNGVTEMKRVDDIEPEGSVLVTPQYEKYGLRVNPRLLPRLKSMGPQFAYALNVPHTAVEVDGNIVYVRIPRSRRDMDGPLTFEQAWEIDPNIPRGNLLLGVDEEQQQLVLELTAPTNVHAAVIGMTGSGKSTLMRTMILSALKIRGIRVALFDPSRGFEPLSGHPLIWRGGLFSSPDDCELGLDALASSIGRRGGELTFVFVDEVPDLIMQRPRIREHLARLAQAGRHAGIHLILGAQQLLASEIGSMTLRNIPVRLVGRVTDRTAAYNAAGRGDIGAENLRGSGDFIAVNGSTSRHFQAALVSEDTLREWATRYPPREPRVPVRADTGAHSNNSWQANFTSHGGGGGGGRPLDDIPQVVIEKIQTYMAEYGQEPSSNWIYQLTRKMLPTGGFNRDKARRALDMATGRAEITHAEGQPSHEANW